MEITEWQRTLAPPPLLLPSSLQVHHDADGPPHVCAHLGHAVRHPGGHGEAGRLLPAQTPEDDWGQQALVEGCD